jgi:hypothetical protein
MLAAVVQLPRSCDRAVSSRGVTTTKKRSPKTKRQRARGILPGLADTWNGTGPLVGPMAFLMWCSSGETLVPDLVAAEKEAKRMAKTEGIDPRRAVIRLIRFRDSGPEIQALLLPARTRKRLAGFLASWGPPLREVLDEVWLCVRSELDTEERVAFEKEFLAITEGLIARSTVVHRSARFGTVLDS